MKKYLLLLLFIISSGLPVLAANAIAPSDFLGRVHIPKGIEVEALDFMDNTTLYAATNGDGLYVSYDLGTTWDKVNNFPIDGQYIEDMIVVGDGVIYIASMGGGIFKTADYGQSWTVLNKGLTNLRVQTIARMGNGYLFAGTYGSGVFFSTDDGANWVRSDKGFRYDNITDIEIMSSGFVLAATNGGGFYSTRDTAKTWIRASTGLDNLFLNDLVSDRFGNKLYAATNGDGVKFTANGITWIPYGNKMHLKYAADLVPLMDTAITSVGINDQQILMGTRSAGMYYWDDLWNAWASTGPRNVGITAIATSKSGTIVATRSYGDVIRSINEGENWEICAAGIVDTAATIASNSFQTEMFVSEFGESIISVYRDKKAQENHLYRSDDRGYSWKYLTKFTKAKDSINIINDVAFSPDSCVFITTNYKVLVSTDYGKTFPNAFQEPGEHDSVTNYSYVQFDSLTRTVSFIYTLLQVKHNEGSPPTIIRQGSKLYTSQNYGTSWTAKDFGKDMVSNHYVNNNTGDWILRNAGNILKSTNNGQSYSTVSSFAKSYIQAVDGTFLFRDTILGGKYQLLYVSEDYGATTKKIALNPTLPEGVDFWEIVSFNADAFGGVYCNLRYTQTGIGTKYLFYYKAKDSEDWQDITSCYNMDKIKKYDCDLNGYCYILTNALYKRIAPDKMVAPQIVAPANKEAGQSTKPRMVWHPAEFAEEYELQIAPTEFFDSPFETNVTGDTVCQITVTLSNSTDYWWRLRSKTHATRSDWTINRFTTGMSAPALKSPADSSVGVALEPKLVWRKHYEATHYTVQVATDTLFENIVFAKENVTDTTITSTTLGGTKTYFWRVRAFSAKNISEWAEEWEFKTIMGPPMLIAPENNAIDQALNTELKWEKVSIATQYFVEVATDIAFTSVIYADSANGDTTHLLTNLEPEVTYFWRVASENAEGRSLASQIWNFTTTLPSVMLIAPENNSVNIALGTPMTWEAHLSGNKYQIQISTGIDFATTTIIEDEIITNTSEYVSNKVGVYSNYFWRVRVILDKERTGLWSEIWTYKTGIKTTTLVEPVDNTVDVVFYGEKFKWNKVDGATYYQLQISANEDFTDLVFSRDSLTSTSWNVTSLLPDTKHYWRVRAWNPESKQAPQWSERWEFTTKGITLELRFPANAAKDIAMPALLKWATSPDKLDNFELDVATDAQFANIVFNKTGITAHQYTLTKAEIPQLTEYTTYYWRIRVRVYTYTSEYVDAWSFTTSTVAVTDIAESVRLYPQPANSAITLFIDGLNTSLTGYYITDINGKIVMNDDTFYSTGNHQIQINTSAFANGKYFLVLKTDKAIAAQEFVIVK